MPGKLSKINTSKIPEDGERLDPARTVFRFFKQETPVHQPADMPGLTRDDFSLSSTDIAAAERKRKPPRLSVWDRDLTSLAQGRRFLKCDKPYGPFSASVAEILSLNERHTISTLGVVYDPLEEPEANYEGAEGHAGIEGLKRPANQENSRTRMRVLKDDLAQLFDFCSDTNA